MEQRSPRDAAAIGLLAAMAAAVFLSARLSYAFSLHPSDVVVAWIPAGVVLAALLLLPKSRWPLAVAGAFVGNALADHSMGTSVAISLYGAAANCFESIVAAWIVRRLAGAPPASITLGTMRQVVALIAGGAFASNGVTAFLGAGVLHPSDGPTFARAWFVWWVGDGIGMLVFAPLILTWSAVLRSEAAPQKQSAWEGAALFAGLTALAFYVLGKAPEPDAFPDTNPYMLLPFLFWAALRFGPPGAATATAILTCVTAWYAARAIGPFAAAGVSNENQVAQAYAYLGIVSLSSLIPAAALSDRRQAEANLRESERHYRALFDANPHPMWIVELGRPGFLAVNDAAVRQYGYRREEFLARSTTDLEPAGASSRANGTHTQVRKDGSRFEAEVIAHDVIWRGRPARLFVAMDVTERQALQRQLLQAQKMEAIGHLAGGIAHDFNNLLSVIIGYAEIGLMSLPEADPLRDRFEQIKKASDRAADLTRQLLAFSRKQVIEPRVIDLNAVISDLGDILKRTIGEDVRLTTVLASDLDRVKADPGQVEQVILNLAVNARDAMPAGGCLTIETANASLDEDYARGRMSVVPGAYVMLAVTDTGTGMDAETQRQIFDPFFTTKAPGKGTGLGLSTVYGIVKQAGGYVWVYSELRQGTTFKIYLPRVEADAAAVARAPLAGSLDGTETILLVEDAEGVRELAQECLESKGYRVLAAQDATHALELARAAQRPIHLLLTDVVLPGAGGRDVARDVLALHPEARVIYMSGYPSDAIVHHGVLDPGIAFLHKPFVLNDLWRKVRSVLDSPNA